MREPKDMLMTELQGERQLLKSWLFTSRYGSRIKIVDGQVTVVRIEQNDDEKRLEVRFKALTDELIRRREEEAKWRRTESES